jgi:CTP synthase
LIFSGISPDGTLMEFMELKSHPFFVATQAHPEFKSRPGRPDPAFYGFLKSALDKKMGKPHPEFDINIVERVEANHTN